MKMIKVEMVTGEVYELETKDYINTNCIKDDLNDSRTRFIAIADFICPKDMVVTVTITEAGNGTN